MYRLEIKLKQHTPLIHFQPYQEGATLRASEVKPKLDRFIIDNWEIVKGKIFTEKYFINKSEAYKQFIEKDVNEIVKNRTSFDYKLSIKNTSDDIDKYILASSLSKGDCTFFQKQDLKTISNSPYFANDSVLKSLKKSDKPDLEDTDLKLGLMFRKSDVDRVILNFGFYDQNLECFIRDLIPVFFIVTNFGTRQDKGFGCFYPENKKDVYDLFHAFFPVVIRSSKPEKNLEHIINKISAVSKELRSGTSKCDSKIRQFYNRMNPPLEWEKPEIQKKISEITRQKPEINEVKSPEIRFVRALLGLPEIYEYPGQKRKQNIKLFVKYKNEGDKDDDVKRYPSPLIFKVFDDNIYIFPTLSKENINGKTFKITSGDEDEKPIFIKVPDAFDINSFLRESFKESKDWEII